MKKQGIWSLSIRMGICAMTLTGISLALPRTADELAFTLPQNGALVSIQYAGFTLAVLLGGALSDRFGQARVLRLSLLGAALALALLGAIWTYWVAIVAVLMIGASGSVMENAVTALAVADEKHQDRNNLIVQIAFSAGAIVLPLLMLLSQECFGAWRYPFWVVAAGALLLFIGSPRSDAVSQRPTMSVSKILSQFLSFFKNPKYLIAPAAMFLYVGAETGFWSFAPVYFESGGLGVHSAIIAAGIIWFAMMLGRMLTAWVVEKLGIIRTMAAFGVLALLSLALMMLSTGVWAIVWVAFAGFSCAPFFPLIVTWMTRITGQNSSTMIAFTMACGTVGSILTGILMGVIGEKLGTWSVMLTPLVCFVGIMVMLGIFGRRSPAEAAK